MQASQVQHRSRKAAILWLAVLVSLFLLAYGTTLWLAGLRANVPSLYFDWERQLPFVPELMLPYMSLNLFFVASVFLCRTRRELDRHALRMVLAILVSCVAFLLFPLRFAFERPEVEGFNGILLTVLATLDRPYNQAPSLHISLLLLLWLVYARRLAMPWRLLLHVWFALIGLSVVLVYQHHMIDVVAGFAVGMACLYLLPDGELPLRSARLTQDAACRRLGAWHVLAGLGCMLVAAWWQGAAWLLLWPALALLLVASAYLCFGPCVFQKRDGRHTLPARCLLAPYLAATWLFCRLVTLGRPAAVPVAADVSIGRLPRLDEAGRWGAIVDLTAEFSSSARPRHYENIPLLDGAEPDPQALGHAAQAIERARQAGPVLVHCAEGASRSVMAVIAWMVHHGHARDVGHAEALLARHWRTDLSPGQRAALAAAFGAG